jgi:hypothetical protein
MSPPQGVPYRQKKSIRAKRPGTNSPSAGPSHRRIKSMSSASTDQMMQDCFRRDPNVTLNELPDLGSMSMESSDLMKFTSEDWQEAFIQIGRDSEGDISGTAPGGQALPRRSLGSMDSTLGNNIYDYLYFRLVWLIYLLCGGFRNIYAQFGITCQRYLETYALASRCHSREEFWCFQSPSIDRPRVLHQERG